MSIQDLCGRPRHILNLRDVPRIPKENGKSFRDLADQLITCGVGREQMLHNQIPKDSISIQRKRAGFHIHPKESVISFLSAKNPLELLITHDPQNPT